MLYRLEAKGWLTSEWGPAAGRRAKFYRLTPAGRRHIIAGNTEHNKFITFFYAVLDTESKTLEFTNAGHNPPLLARTDGSSESLADGGPVLGIFENFDYEQGRVVLRSGDRLALFTDGATEVWDSQGQEFGDDGLLEILRTHLTLDAVALTDAIVRRVTDFSRGDFRDDLTLLVVAAN